MENEKVTPKDRPKPRSRRKVKNAKNIISEVTEQVLKFPPQEQNVIIKELLFAIQEKRKMLIEQSRENTDKFNAFFIILIVSNSDTGILL